MENSTTLISDLPPENITYNLSSVETKIKKEAIQPPIYAPLDVHKNPYMAESMQGGGGGGGGPPIHLMHGGGGPPPPHIIQMMNRAQQQQRQMNMPQYPLPSRDIPQLVNQFQDIEAQPNYIPAKKLTRDFVLENDDLTEKKRGERKRRKQREQAWRVSWDEMNLPILLAILFFLFQLPWLNGLLFKYITFLPLYGTDGIMNNYGLVLKSLLYAGAFFIINKFTNIVSLQKPLSRQEEEEED